MITGKGPTRAIGTVHTRGQADNNQPCMRVTKGRHRFGEIIGLVDAHLGQEIGQA